jgi:hypothetical protein
MNYLQHHYNRKSVEKRRRRRRQREGKRQMKNGNQLFRITLIVLLATLFWSGSALAVSSYLTEFQGLYPGSTTGTTAWSSTSARCNVCHSSGGDTPINSYGNAWALRHNAGRTVVQSFMDIEPDNSDGSSVINISEIIANAQPGWSPGATNTLYNEHSPGTVVATNQNPPTTLVGPVDPPALPTVTMKVTDGSASEVPSTDTGKIQITRTGATTSALTVFYTITGTATNGTDYRRLRGQAIIKIGKSSTTVVIQPIDDTIVEPDETVILTLSANAAYTIGSPSSGTVVIHSNE